MRCHNGRTGDHGHMIGGARECVIRRPLTVPLSAGQSARPVVVSGRAGWFRANSAEQMIVDRRNFRTHGSLSGRWINSVPADTGQMTEAFRAELAADIRESGVVFAVFSYLTPIGWIADRGTVEPSTRYVSDYVRKDGQPKTSVTTAKHCGTMRLAFAVYSGEYARPDDWDRK